MPYETNYVILYLIVTWIRFYTQILCWPIYQISVNKHSIMFNVGALTIINVCTAVDFGYSREEL